MITWLDRIGNERWARSCLLVVRCNIMTSNSVESVSTLSRDVGKLPITMLIDFLSSNYASMVVPATKKDVTKYVEKFIDRRINKSSAFRVYRINQSRYKVTDQMKNGIVNLESCYYTCGKWQLSGIPCTHPMAVFKELRYQDCSVWVSSYFIMETYRSTYVEVVFRVPVPAEYEEPDKVMVVLPPLMDKQQVGRPKNHNRILS
uniref:SWIM-type domain-containing protein n=1 Tax=Lactuca sativa TaxID=4236 RepID=A0A9R1UGS6_LACSA|nr:hypothetical protein LSAT_V11C900482550 [Lactuca sativa]